MLTCKDATRLISESMDRSLPLRERIGVRIHLLVCRYCVRYERQLRLIRDTVRRIAAAGEQPWEPFGESLPEEARERIGRSLRGN